MRKFFALNLIVAAAAFAQTPRLEFEVASVRQSAPSGPERVDVGLHLDGSQARISTFTLRDYVAMAYRVKAFQVTGPDAITVTYDVSAKLPAGATRDQIPEMLQSFLADRFQLKFHREKKDLPVYALIVGKPPLKLKEAAETPVADPQAAVNVGGSGSGAGVSVNLGNGSSYTFANGKFEATKITMDALVNSLERYLDRPVVNQTDLKGRYDFTVNVTPEDYQAMLIRAAVNVGVVLPPQVQRLMETGSAASFFDNLQQLGLKLDARKASMDVLVIDQVAKTPTEN
jgi:uncharacterized protein (TIGR03435 family)